MSQIAAASSIYFIRHQEKHPLDEANLRLWSIMTMAAQDIEDMCNEKGEEWPEEQR